MADAQVSPRSRRYNKLLPVLLSLLLAALLHLLAWHWGKRYVDHRLSDTSAETSISVTLRPLPPPQQAVSLPLASAPKPVKQVRQAKPVHAAPPPAPPVVALDTATVTSVMSSDSETPIASANEPVPAPASTSAVTTSAADTPTPPAEPAASQNGTHYQLDPPPSAALEYAVHAFSDKMDWYGTSKLTWKTDGSHYTIDGEVYARFIAKITFLTYTSSGAIDAFGIAPQRYTEQKRNRPATITSFDADSKRISFSSSGNSYPRVGGEQDRASLIWQLAAIGRGDQEKFNTGSVIDLFVAGVRDGEVWRMQIAGQESINLPSGQAQAWHVVRQPRPGSYEQRLDIWLAPQQQWYPVRLRFSETNGDYLEMTLSDLKTL
jgi:hypothetical protein